MNQKTNKGITLIALVITIIVLLILAGVTISMVLGDDGIIQNAQAAKEMTEAANEKEDKLLKLTPILMDIRINAQKIIAEKTYGIKKEPEEVREYIPSYDEEEYTIWIIKGNVLCAPSEAMTPEKIALCEENGIYLWGDLDENGITNDYDLKILYNYLSGQFEMTERLSVLLDLDGSGIINSSDENSLHFECNKNGTYDAIKAEIASMKEEFEKSEAYNNENITVTEYEEVKKYIPSYTDARYNFAILRGKLFVYEQGELTDERFGWCRKNYEIYLYGDVNNNGRVNRSDRNAIRDYLECKDSEEELNDLFTEEELELILLLGDIDLNGVIDESDVTAIEALIEV